MNNREIKFRVWDFKHKRFREKNLHSNMDGISTCGRYFMRYTDHDSWPDGRGCSMDIKDFVILQYTGLKDRNGKEIYEGDILEDSTGMDDVYFKDGCFWVGDQWLYDQAYCNEVVGNIYENPELLK